MTQYKDRVKRQKLKIAAEEWGRQVKYMLAADGVLEIAYNNGEKHFEDTTTGKKWKTGIDLDKETLMDKFARYMADVQVGRDPNGL